MDVEILCVFLESQRCVREEEQGGAQYPLASENSFPPHRGPAPGLESFFIMGAGAWFRVCAEVRGQPSGNAFSPSTLASGD